MCSPNVNTLTLMATWGEHTESELQSVINAVRSACMNTSLFDNKCIYNWVIVSPSLSWVFCAAPITNKVDAKTQIDTLWEWCKPLVKTIQHRHNTHLPFTACSLASKLCKYNLQSICQTVLFWDINKLESLSCFSLNKDDLIVW